MTDKRMCPGFGSAVGHSPTPLRKLCDPCTALLNQRRQAIEKAIENIQRLSSDEAWARTTLKTLSDELDRLLESA